VIRLDLTGWEVPITSHSHVNFRPDLSVDVKVSILKAHHVTGQCHDPFHIHDTISRHADHDHIPDLGRVKKIGDPAAEIEASVVVGGFHANSLNLHRNANLGEKYECEPRDEEKSNDISESKPGKEKGSGGKMHRETIFASFSWFAF